MKKRFWLLLLFCIFFTGCSLNYSKVSKYVDEKLSESEDAVIYLENEFEKRKIVFVGSTDHSIINDTLFFDYDTICRLYRKGLRYVFFEGGNSSERIINDGILIFYPWEHVGVYDVEPTIIQNIQNVNKTVAREDPIIIIHLEDERQNFLIDDKDEDKTLNYRDKYMFLTASKYIDEMNPEKKVLIICGSDHGCKDRQIRVNPENSLLYEWTPLGSLLYEKYKDDYLALSFIAIDSCTRDSIYYRDLFNSKWLKTDSKVKAISVQQLENINEKICFLFDESYKDMDAYIVQKQADYGILYCYRLVNNDNARAIISQTKQIYEYFKAKDFYVDYDNVEEAYLIEFFTRNIYYLRFTYGNNFPYNFWNYNKPLSDAIRILEGNMQPVNFFADDDIEEYQTLIRGMYYLQYSNEKENVDFYMKNGKWQIKRAKEIIKNEIWSDYWLLMMNYRMKNYKTALEICDELLGNEQVFSSICLPEIYSVKTECLKRLDMSYSETEEIKNSLFNELCIDVSKLHLFIY